MRAIECAGNHLAAPCSKIQWTHSGREGLELHTERHGSFEWCSGSSRAVHYSLDTSAPHALARRPRYAGGITPWIRDSVNTRFASRR
ncbi:hypothetical protein HDC93_005316 [Streptomyces sp. AK010]|nr:hypothetical protein [Streptomyces sp. AK010]